MNIESNLPGKEPQGLPSLSLRYSGDDSFFSTVLDFDATIGVSKTFSGVPGDSFPIQGATLCCWIKSTQIDPNAVLFSYGPTIGSNAGRLWVTNPANLTLNLGEAGGGVVSTGLACNDGTWRHLLVSVAPTGRNFFGAQVWIDGILRWQAFSALVITPGTGLAVSGTFTLGLGNGGTETGLIGQASEFQIWDASVVSPAQTAAWMMQCAQDGQQGLVLHWPLDVPPSGNTIPTNNFVSSTLCFRQPEAGQSQFGRAEWPIVAGADSYELQVIALDGLWAFDEKGITAETGQSIVTVPLPELQPQKTYQARVRTTVAGTSGDWSATVNLVPLFLPTTALSFSWPSSGNLSAQWMQVDQAQSYQVAVTQGATTTTSTQTLLTQAVSSTLLTGVDAVSIAVRGSTASSTNASGVLGASNSLGYTDKTALGFYFEDPDGSGNGNFAFDWTPTNPAPAFFYMEVSKGGVLITSGHVDGSTTPPALLPAPAPVQTGEQYVGRMRRIDAGVLAAWDNQTVTIHSLSAPAPVYQAAVPPAAENLALSWGSVASGAIYNLDVYVDGASQPQPNANVTSPYSLMTWLSNTSIPADNHSYTYHLRALLDGEIGPSSPVIAPPVLNTAFQYVWNGGQDGGTLSATWTPATDAGSEVYTRVFQDSASTPSQFGKVAVTDGVFAVTPPVGGFVENAVYDAQVRALTMGVMTAAQFVHVVIHQMSTLVVQVVRTSPSAIAIQAQWLAVNPGLTVQYQVALDGAVTPPLQSALTFNLTAHLDDTAALTIQVRAEADQSYGPQSVVATPSPLTPAFRYTLTAAGTQSLAATWTASPLVYLSAQQTGGGAADQQLFSDGTTQIYNLPTPAGGFSENTVYTLSIKNAANGALSAMTVLPITIHQLAQPIVTFSALSSANPVLMEWNDVRTATQASAGLVVSYLVAANGIAVANQPLPSIRNYDLSTQISTDGQVLMTAQPSADGSYGIVSGPPTTLVAPAISSLTYDAASLQLTLSFAAATGAADYYAEVRQDTDHSLQGQQWLSAQSGQVSYSVPFNASSLTLDSSYTVKVRALAGGTLTAFASQSLTIKQLAGPSSVALAPDFPSRKIGVTWQFDTSGLGSVTYVAELLQTDGTVLDQQTPTTQQATLTYPSSMAAGTTLNVLVRAVAGGNLGLWCVAQPVTVGSSLAQVVLTGASFDSNNNLTVTWNPVAGSGVQYQVKITGPSSYSYTAPATTGTSITLNKTDTNVADYTQYSITVCAITPAPAGPWSTPWTATTNILTPPDPGGSGGSGSSGDPVILATGWYSYDNIDLEVSGVVALRFITYYNSFAALPGDNPPGIDRPLGRRWNHVYNSRLAMAADGRTAALQWGNGVTSIYNVPASVTGLFVKQGQPNGNTLLRNADLSFTLTQRDQGVYRFDSGGVLTQIVSPQGNAVNLTYQSGALNRITDQSSGRYLTLTYYTSGADVGRIATVTDGTGRSITYQYTSGDLTQYTDVSGLTRQFTYWPNSLMHTAIDQCSNTFITNSYDSQNRVIQQLDGQAVASGQNYYISFTYADVTADGVACVQTTVTDRMSYVTVNISQKVTLNTISEVHQLANGEVWRVLRSFDGVGNLLTETSYQGPSSGAANVGNTTTYTYDGACNQLSVTDPLGRTARMTYDSHNNLLTRSDFLGNVTVIAYVPGTNLVQSITEPSGAKRVYTYHTVGTTIQGLVDTVTEYPAGNSAGMIGNVTAFRWHLDTGDLYQQINPFGASQTYTYDVAGRGWVKSVQTKDAQDAVALDIDRQAWPSGLTHSLALQYPGQTAADAYITSTTYDGVGMLTQVTDPLQRTTTYGYNANSQLQSITYPAASNPDVTTYVRNRNDLATQIIRSPSAPVVSTGYGYDEVGRIISVTDGNIQVTTIVWSMNLQAAGTACSVTATLTDPAVVVNTPGALPTTVTYQRQITYDALGRPIAWTERTPVGGSPGPQTSVVYDTVTGLNGQVNARVTTTYPKADSSQPLAYTAVDVFNPAGRLISHTDERGKVWITVYGVQVDADSNTCQTTSTTTDPLGNQQIFVTDAIGREAGLKIGNASTAWRTTSIVYDVLDRPIRVDQTNPIPNPPTPMVSTSIAYAFDTASKCQRVTVSPYQLASSQYSIDGAGQWVGYTDAHGIATSMTYTPRGQMLTYLNGRGQTLTYGYDRAGRYVSTTPPDASSLVAQVLDGNGNRLQTKVGGTAQITRSFDTLNRMTSRTNVAQSDAVAYSFTPNGAIATLLYPGLTTPVNYGYDNLNHLRTVTDWAGRATQYTYAPNGVLATGTFPNNVAVTFTQDDAGQFTGYQASIGTDLLATATLQLNAYAEPSQIEQLMPLAPNFPSGGHTLTYVDADRLATADGVALTYDGDGNMTSLPGVTGTLSHNVYNQLTGIGTASYAFDADGLLNTASVGGAARNYVQDPAGYTNPMIARPDPATDPSGALFTHLLGGGAALAPPQNALASPWLPGAPMNRILASVDGGNVSARYVHGVGLIGRELADGSFQTYVFDAVGSTLALVGAAGMSDAYAYTPYGQTAGHQGTSDNPFTLHGRWGVLTDPSGLCFMRARTYAPDLMRFIEKDPLVGNLYSPQSLNRYAFAPDNPLQFLDPLGLSGNKDGGEPSGGAIAGIVIGSIVVGGAVIAGAAIAGAGFGAPAGLAAGLTGGAVTADLGAGATLSTRLAFRVGQAARRLPNSWVRSLRQWARIRAGATSGMTDDLAGMIEMI